MMKTGCTGTERPKNGTGGLRRVVLALAVLLLTCVLTAGAVSASDGKWHNVTSFEELKSNLEDGNWTRLGQDITDSSGQIFLEDVDDARFDLNGHTLTMNVVDHSAIVIGGESGPEKASLTVRDSKGGGKVNATNNYLFFVRNESTLTLESGIFEANYSAIAGNANGQCSNPTFTVKEGVELVSHGDVAVFLPAKGTNATITGATITGKLGGVSIAAGNITIKDTKISVVDSGASLDGWTEGPNSDGSAIAIHKLSNSYKGELTLRLLGTTSLSSQSDAVFHNYISADQFSLGKTEVIIADTVKLNGNITSATYGENCQGDGGVFKDTNGNRLLYPSLNQTGVQWTGDDESGYTLSITAPGSYKLMDDVTLTSMKVDAAATINGNEKTLTLSGTNGYQGVIIVDNGATLQNLNVVAKEGAAFGTAIKVMDGSLTDSTINLRHQNAQPSSGTGPMSAIAVSVKKGEISRNTILAGNSEKSSSQCVVVSGSGVTVSDNTLTTGKSAAERDGKRTSGSVGIRLSSEASGTTTITGNTITSQQEGTMNNGIAADGVKNDVTIDASGNTFDLAATGYGGAFYVNPNPNPESGTITVTLDAEENTVESAASFIYADNAEKATAYTISGEIKNNDFAAADKGLVSADGLTLTLEDLNQNGNSGLITDPSESLTVNSGESEITVTGAEVKQGGDNVATITFTGYEILITNATLSGSNIIIYDDDSTATVTHNTVHHMGSLTNIDVELLITNMSKLEEISTPKATIGDAEKKQLAAEKITPLSVVDIHYEDEPGFDQITLTISDLISSGEIIGFHVGESGVDTSEVTIKDGKHIVTFTGLTSASPFGIGVISDGPQSPSSSSSGNMDNAYRVLFNDGSTTLSVQTDLSSGDKLTKPETPVKSDRPLLR